MRNLILFILILLGSVSCGTRHKIKIADVQKREIDNEKTYQGETQNLENSSEKVPLFNEIGKKKHNIFCRILYSKIMENVLKIQLLDLLVLQITKAIKLKFL